MTILNPYVFVSHLLCWVLCVALFWIVDACLSSQHLHLTKLWKSNLTCITTALEQVTLVHIALGMVQWYKVHLSKVVPNTLLSCTCSIHSSFIFNFNYKFFQRQSLEQIIWQLVFVTFNTSLLCCITKAFSFFNAAFNSSIDLGHSNSVESSLLLSLCLEQKKDHWLKTWYNKV